MSFLQPFRRKVEWTHQISDMKAVSWGQALQSRVVVSNEGDNGKEQGRLSGHNTLEIRISEDAEQGNRNCPKYLLNSVFI